MSELPSAVPSSEDAAVTAALGLLTAGADAEAVFRTVYRIAYLEGGTAMAKVEHRVTDAALRQLL